MWHIESKFTALNTTATERRQPLPTWHSSFDFRSIYNQFIYTQVYSVVYVEHIRYKPRRVRLPVVRYKNIPILIIYRYIQVKTRTRPICRSTCAIVVRIGCERIYVRVYIHKHRANPHTHTRGSAQGYNIHVGEINNYKHGGRKGIGEEVKERQRKRSIRLHWT